MTEARRQKRRYAAFLSYCHQDNGWAAWVHRSIERYRLPAKLVVRDADARSRLKPIFRDREELPSAGDLGEKITQALAHSRALIVVCSPACARSKWTNQEILRYKQLHGERAIFCLIVDGEPGAGDARECFPPALRFRLDQDGTLSDRPVEPIAADVRPGKDGKQLARLKLIAGLLGVGLDDLRQRDQQRRNRNLLVIAAASMAGMALTGALAITAMVARDDAERRQAQAEDLVEFMLGDLKSELGKVGRLDALDATARKAEEYFSELPEDELDDEALAGRAKAYLAIGEIHFDRLEWDQALRTYGKALETNQALYRRNPGSPDYLFGLAQSEFWVGYVHLESGDPGGAEPYFRRYLDHSLALLGFDSENPDWIMEVSYGHSNLAGIFEQTGRQGDALDHAIEGVEWNREAVLRAPDEPYYREELAGALDWLSRSQLRNGQLRDSAETRREARSIYSGILQSDPDNRLAEQRLAAALRAEARAVHFLGEHERAFELLGESLDNFIAITRHDPTNELWSFWARDTALDWLLLQQEAALRESPPQRVMDLLNDYTTQDYGNDAFREARRLLAQAMLAMHRPANRSPDEGRPSVIDQARDALNRLQNNNQTDNRILWEVVRFHLARAYYLQDPGLESQTINVFLDTLGAAAENSRDPLVLSLHAQLALNTGNPARAARSVDALIEMGFATRRFNALLRTR